jgi:FkbM family methyltransferase
MDRTVQRVLGRMLSAKQRKFLRYFAVRAREAVGIDQFPALDGLDRKLLPYLNDIPNGIFIEAGANDGLNQSNTWHLERRLGWRGLLVEPVPEIAALCRRFRRSQVVCHALGDFAQEGSTVTLHFGGLMTATEGADLSHMQDGDARSHAQAGANWVGGKTYSFESRIAALSTLIDQAKLPKIDLLSLDVEGFEVNVLNGIDFKRHPIRYILVETSNFEAVKTVLDQYYDFVDQLSRHDYLFRYRATA